MALGALDDWSWLPGAPSAGGPAALGRLNGYLRAVAVMAETVSVEASPAVLDRVMSAALAARPRGGPIGLARGIDEVESFRRTAASLLAVRRASATRGPAPRFKRSHGARPREHLVGVERYVDRSSA